MRWLQFGQQEDVRKTVEHRKRGAKLITPHLTPYIKTGVLFTFGVELLPLFYIGKKYR
jgi:hypothetical protein